MNYAVAEILPYLLRSGHRDYAGGIDSVISGIMNQVKSPVSLEFLS